MPPRKPQQNSVIWQGSGNVKRAHAFISRIDVIGSSTIAPMGLMNSTAMKVSIKIKQIILSLQFHRSYNCYYGTIFCNSFEKIWISMLLSDPIWTLFPDPQQYLSLVYVRAREVSRWRVHLRRSKVRRPPFIVWWSDRLHGWIRWIGVLWVAILFILLNFIWENIFIKYNIMSLILSFLFFRLNCLEF